MYVTDNSGILHERHIMREDVGATYAYTGFADPGALESAAAWSIMRETLATGAINYADSGRFNQIWDNRAALTYA